MVSLFSLFQARFLHHFSMVSTNSQQDSTLLEGLKLNNLNSYLNLSSNNFPNNHKRLGSKGRLHRPGRSLHPLQAQILGTIFKQWGSHHRLNSLVEFFLVSNSSLNFPHFRHNPCQRDSPRRSRNHLPLRGHPLQLLINFHQVHQWCPPKQTHHPGQ